MRLQNPELHICNKSFFAGAHILCIVKDCQKEKRGCPLFVFRDNLLYSIRQDQGLENQSLVSILSAPCLPIATFRFAPFLL